MAFSKNFKNELRKRIHEEVSVSDLIELYAEVYQGFENLQPKIKDDLSAVFPAGDHKTGVIGEYYAKRFLEHTLKKEVRYAASGEGHDLYYFDESNGKIKIQVKCVSSHSVTKTISPIKILSKTNELNFDHLYLMGLDKQFKPCSFYTIPVTDLKKYTGIPLRIVGAKMKLDDCEGSKVLGFKEDRISELLVILNEGF